MNDRTSLGRVGSRGGGAPTINDVARHAGVSPTTVSRVINGETNVRPAKREAVLASVAALHFSPNPAARRLAGSAPLRIGLLYSNPSAAYLSEFLVGSLDQASRLGVQLMIERCEVGEDAIAAARRLVDHGVDGLLLTPPLGDLAALVEAILAEDGLAVIVGSGRPHDDLPAVSIDDCAAALAMTRHLVTLGHRRIGFVIGARDVSVSEDRLRGYSQGLAEAAIEPDRSLVVQGDFTYRSGLEAARHLLDLPQPPSAIFASNDDMAAAAVAEAQRRGIEVPAGLTVCGFDDTTLATAIWPELTTIHQPIADMAREAMAMLTDAIHHRRGGGVVEPEHRLLAFELVQRESHAGPRRVPSARMALPSRSSNQTSAARAIRNRNNPQPNNP